MKNLIKALALSAILLAPFARGVVLISDFTVPPATEGNLVTYTGNLANSTANTGVWKAVPGANGSGLAINTSTGGNAGGYIQSARSYSDSQLLAIATWINISNYGLVAGNTYSLQFDYKVDRVGDRAYYANAGIRYGIAESTNTYTELRYTNSLTLPLTMSTTAGNLLLGYETGLSVATPSQTAWTTFTSSRTFTISPGTTKLAIVIEGLGYGVGNNNWVAPANASYTYLGIDNVSLVPVPEPAACAAIVAGLSLLLLVVRRRGRTARA